MNPYYSDDQITLYHGDALDLARQLPTGSVDCIVTSPPYYGLRDYGADGQYGLEPSPREYVERLRALFGELRRVLADDGTLWLNLVDSYASGLKGCGGIGEKSPKQKGALLAGQHFAPRAFNAGVPHKNLLGIPWRVAFALQDDGWILRNAIIWNKPNPMPESVTDRLSGRYEHVFLFAKQERYWFDLDPIRRIPVKAGGKSWEQRKAAGERSPHGLAGAAALGVGELRPHEAGTNPGDVWTIPDQPFPGAHFACYPIQLPQRCIQAGCKPGGTVCDPFHGSGTTGQAAQRTGRRYIGVYINAEYLDLSLNTRLRNATLDFTAPTEGTA